jgi:NADH pyrophosphatase NudC (nudix superfamily)
MKAKMEAILDELLAEKENPETITLSEIEQLVRAAGERVKAELTAGLVKQASEEDRAGAAPVCAGCGQRMHYKGQKGKYIETETGPVEVKRAYYYCPTCREGIFPPGPTVETGCEPV